MASTGSAYMYSARRPKTAPQSRSARSGARGSAGGKRSKTARKSRKGRNRYDRNVWNSAAYVMFNVEDAIPIEVNELVQTVMTKCCEEITERMQPQNMFNRFLKKSLFPGEIVRDMQELSTTVEKNKTIQDKVHANTDIYKQFKICLAETGQFPLVETLQICEIRTHDELKASGYRCDCKNTENCGRLLSIRCSLAKYIHISVAMPQEENPVTQLQSNLINIYEYFCQRPPVYPLRAEGAIPIENLYVMPNMHEVDPFAKKTWKSVLADNQKQAIGEPKPTYIHSYRDIFYTNDTHCKNIYVVSEAGLGKSALCERLINTWYKAHSARQKNADAILSDDEETMAKFSLLFYICLSAASDDSHIEEMIRHQQLTTVEVSTFLEKEKCLVILDGLDEWKPNNYRGSPFVTEGLPVRKMNMKNTTVLTTTRPWKLETLELQEQEIDKQINITGMGSRATETLSENVMEGLAQKSKKDSKNQTTTTHKVVGEFTKQTTDIEIKKLKNVPVLLMQILSVWCDGLPFGQSQCEIYANIIARQLKLADQMNGHHEGGENGHRANGNDPELPLCLDKNKTCRQYARLLYALSKFAYDTLTGLERENLLVADNTAAADHNLVPDDLSICFQTGLLTQNMYFGTVTDHLKLIKFAHKTHHEFFAAIYLAKFAEEDEIEYVLNALSSFEVVVDMEKLVLFVCGLNPSLGCMLSKVMIEKLSQEEEVAAYRGSCREPEFEQAYPLIMKLQKIVFDCATEAEKNNHIDASFYIGDLVLIRDTFASIKHHLRALNPEMLLTACITIDADIYIDKKQELRGIVDHVWQSKCLQKFYLDDRRNAIEADRIFTTVSATSSTIRSLVLANVNLSDLGSKLTPLLFSPQLTALGLGTVAMTQEQIGILAKFVEDTRQLQELYLGTLLVDGSRAMGYKLDLSDQRRLRKLYLRDLFVEEIYLDAAKLTQCEVGYLQIPGTTRAILSYLREETKLQVFECSGCPDDMDAYAVADSLRAFIGLKELVLQNIDFKNAVPRMSTGAEHLKSVKLVNLTISEKALKRCFECFHQESVSVFLDKVSVTCDPDNDDGELTEFVRTKHKNVNVTWYRCRFRDTDNSWKLLTPMS